MSASTERLAVGQRRRAVARLRMLAERVSETFAQWCVIVTPPASAHLSPPGTRVAVITLTAWNTMMKLARLLSPAATQLFLRVLRAPAPADMQYALTGDAGDGDASGAYASAAVAASTATAAAAAELDAGMAAIRRVSSEASSLAGAGAHSTPASRAAAAARAAAALYDGGEVDNDEYERAVYAVAVAEQRRRELEAEEAYGGLSFVKFAEAIMQLSELTRVDVAEIVLRCKHSAKRASKTHFVAAARTPTPGVAPVQQQQQQQQQQPAGRTSSPHRTRATSPRASPSVRAVQPASSVTGLPLAAGRSASTPNEYNAFGAQVGARIVVSASASSSSSIAGDAATPLTLPAVGSERLRSSPVSPRIMRVTPPTRATASSRVSVPSVPSLRLPGSARSALESAAGDDRAPQPKSARRDGESGAAAFELEPSAGLPTRSPRVVAETSGATSSRGSPKAQLLHVTPRRSERSPRSSYDATRGSPPSPRPQHGSYTMPPPAPVGPLPMALVRAMLAHDHGSLVPAVLEGLQQRYASITSSGHMLTHRQRFVDLVVDLGIDSGVLASVRVRATLDREVPGSFALPSSAFAATLFAVADRLQHDPECVPGPVRIVRDAFADGYEEGSDATGAAGPSGRVLARGGAAGHSQSAGASPQSPAPFTTLDAMLERRLRDHGTTPATFLLISRITSAYHALLLSEGLTLASEADSDVLLPHAETLVSVFERCADVSRAFMSIEVVAQLFHAAGLNTRTAQNATGVARDVYLLEALAQATVPAPVLALDAAQFIATVWRVALGLGPNDLIRENTPIASPAASGGALLSASSAAVAAAAASGAAAVRAPDDSLQALITRAVMAARWRPADRVALLTSTLARAANRVRTDSSS